MLIFFMVDNDQNFNDVDKTSLKYHAMEIFKRFLISKGTPNTYEQDSEVEKISKNLSLLIWIGKANILSPQEENAIADKLKDLHYDFKQDELYEKTNTIIQSIKNINHKINILEHFTDIEHQAYISKDTWDEDINSNKLYETFEKIIDFINDEKNQNSFFLMKAERNIKEIKSIYIKDPSKISLLLHNLEKIIHQ